MKIKILLVFIFFSFRIGFANPETNNYCNLIIELPGNNAREVSVVLWQNGYPKEALESKMVKGDSIIYQILAEYLPCQTTLEFKPVNSNERPMSLNVFITDKDVHLQIQNWNNLPNWHKDAENMANETFFRNSLAKKQQFQLLQNFVANYSDKDELQKMATEVYLQKCAEYNKWVYQQINENSKLWVSKSWKNQLMPETEVSLSREENLNGISNHAFNFEDFTDTTLLKTDYFLNLLNNYMRVNEMLVQLKGGDRNCLLTEAGRRLAQKASKGDPRLYGWVVDYLYTNFERYAIHEGITMLTKHVDDPNCLTYKKIEIKRRLDGIQRLSVGNKAPILTVKNSEGDRISLNGNDDQLSLLFFYESDCPHCLELLDQLNRLSKSTDLAKDITISTIALDESIETWTAYSQKQQFVWNDYYVEGGINGKVAKDFCLLSSPSMFVLGKNRTIESTPKNIVELLELFYDEKTITDYLNVAQN